MYLPLALLEITIFLKENVKNCLNIGFTILDSGITI